MNRLIILLCVFLYSWRLQAQEDFNYLRHSIKTNVCQWGMNEANIAYEHRFSLKFGLESTIGFYGIVHILEEGTFSDVAEYRSVPYQGVTVRLNPKIYILTDSRRSAQEFYLSPMMLLKYNKAEDFASYNSNRYYYDQKRKIIGGSVLAGIQSNFAKHLLVDFYCGAGIRYRLITSHKPKHEEFVPSIHLGIKLGYGFKPMD